MSARSGSLIKSSQVKSSQVKSSQVKSLLAAGAHLIGFCNGCLLFMYRLDLTLIHSGEKGTTIVFHSSQEEKHDYHEYMS
jgi:phosphoribosylformylglycinamidine (FGAM) synthase-like amidotransferase family enzyme